MSERRGEDSDCEGIQQQKGGGVVIAEVMRGALWDLYDKRDLSVIKC